MIVTGKFTLSNVTATRIVEASTNPQEAHIHNMSKSSNNFIYIGNSSVSTTNSLHIDPAESKIIRLAPADDLWAVSDPNGIQVGVLAVRLPS
jgi:hypothetical protein